MSHQTDIPVPITAERDDDGRLVGLAFDSVPLLATPEVNPWLVAVDGSDNAMRAVAHAIQQANEMNACALHLVHVQPWLAKEAAEAELAQRAWTLGAFDLEQMYRFFSFVFIHVSAMHALFVVVFTLALGNMVAQNFRP